MTYEIWCNSEVPFKSYSKIWCFCLKHLNSNVILRKEPHAQRIWSAWCLLSHFISLWWGMMDTLYLKNGQIWTMGSILNLLKIRVKNLCDDCIYIHVNPPTSNERREKQYKDKNASDICVCVAHLPTISKFKCSTTHIL